MQFSIKPLRPPLRQTQDPNITFVSSNVEGNLQKKYMYLRPSAKIQISGKRLPIFFTQAAADSAFSPASISVSPERIIYGFL